MQVNSLHKSTRKKMNKFNFLDKDGETKLPPGFRFQPTDVEIVFQYLAPKIFSCPLPASVIPEIQDVSGFHLWNLPAGSVDSDKDRYLFANRELMSVRNANFSSRGSGACPGFWKVTGSDKPIVWSKRMPIVGIRRTLVFYKGKHPCAVRTDWFMHVYCIALLENAACSIHHRRHSQGGLIQIGKWVLCHVFSKKRSVEADGRQLHSCDDFVTTEEMSDTDSCSSDSDSTVCSEVSSSSSS